jgi:hypothetical protein
VLPRLAISAVALAVVAGALDQLGVAGYRQGAVLCTLALPLAVGGLTWLLTRSPWPTAIIVVVAILLSGTLATRAPWSTGRLESALDDLDGLDGFEVLSTEHTGHSWCRPDCPKVTRVWRAPNVEASAAVRQMSVALSGVDLAPDEQPPDVTNQLVINGTKANVIVVAEQGDDDLQVTVILSSHR